MPLFSLHCIRFWLRVAPIFLLAGCWQKIEYSGPDPSSAKTHLSPPTATGDSTQAQQPDSAPPGSVRTTSLDSDNHVATATPGSNPNGEPPQSGIATTVRPSPEVDRYALPAKGDDSNSVSKPAASETQPGTLAQQPLATRHTDATAVSATVNVAPRAVAPNTRRAAWLLGSRLSLAALAHDRGMAADSVPKWLDEARAAAHLLGTSVTELPEAAAAGDNAPASRPVIDYLILQGQRIGRDVSKQHGAEHAALFEVALKSNMLLLLYSPGSSAGNSISAAISRAAPQARLPAELWKPLVDLLSKQSSLTDVRAAVRQMHNDVDRYLANAAEPSGR